MLRAAGFRRRLQGFPALLRAPSYKHHRELHITTQRHRTFAMARLHAVLTVPYPRNPQEHASGAEVYFQGTIGGSSMSARPNEAVIDEIVASCSGDLHGALRALLLVNEQLEAELQQLYAAVAIGGPFERGSNVLH
jgi:hypothetical protein